MLSIIIACYNAVEKMQKCLESLEKQTDRDFEIIIVDDCSKDESFRCLQDFANAADINCTILKNAENLGPGGTRNQGMTAAQGDYITFVDIDDYVEPDFVEKINDAAKTQNPDGIFFDYYYEKDKMKIQRDTVSGVNAGYVSTESAIVLATGGTWCKAYRRSLIEANDISFPLMNIKEDFVFNKLAILHCDKLFYIKEPLYHYIQYPTSIMRTGGGGEDVVQRAFDIISPAFGDKFKLEFEALYIEEYLYTKSGALLARDAGAQRLRELLDELEQRNPDCWENPYLRQMPLNHRIAFNLMRHRRMGMYNLYRKMVNKVKS